MSEQLACDFCSQMDWHDVDDLRKLVRLSKTQGTWTGESAEVFYMTATAVGHSGELVDAILREVHT